MEITLAYNLKSPQVRFAAASGFEDDVSLGGLHRVRELRPVDEELSVGELHGLGSRPPQQAALCGPEGLFQEQRPHQLAVELSQFGQRARHPVLGEVAKVVLIGE